MAKMKKRILRWRGSNSPQVIGYKLYWSQGGEVTYGSSHANLGNVTEILLPDGVESFSMGQGPVEFGVTAVDELGNESDMTTVMAPYQFSVPEPPMDLKIEAFTKPMTVRQPVESPSVLPPEDPPVIPQPEPETGVPRPAPVFKVERPKKILWNE
ncbi:hypothetical protein D3OALGA1CA_815 [Olavius algarvensis associated proteobacterium Delta 3]|nr:hypothetical protein D3OALGA1CA_815 [Olavius algarvensis associated proteobacterium Delta 3]CAB5142601.1 hypothetical protein D3OALGB2SA_4318 [Olavius algarvensis associated proteobacterium Delta 3]